MVLDKVSLLHDLKRLFAHLTKRRRVQLLLVTGLLLVGAVAELAAIGSVLPFLALLSNPTKALEYRVVRHGLALFGIGEGDNLLLILTVLFVCLVLTASFVRLVLAYVSQKFVFRVGHEFGVEVYKRTLYQPYRFHVSKNTSEIISGIDKINTVVFHVLLQLMQAFIATVISLCIVLLLVTINAFVAIVSALGLVLIYFLVGYFARRRLSNNSKLIAAALTRRVRSVQEGLGGIRDVLLDNAQPVYVRQFSRTDLEYRDAQVINSFIGVAPRFVIEATGMSLIAILAWTLTNQGQELSSALPVLGALALGAQRMLPLLQQVYQGWTYVSGARQIIRDVMDLMDLPVVARQHTQVENLKFDSKIEFHEVGFRYADDQPFVLTGINLEIVKGSRIGFVGRTGSGKSTLLDILMGLLTPTQGEVCVDGVAVDENKRRSWQANIAHVPQSIYLSDATIAENIALGIPEDKIDFERVKHVARAAQIADFIEGLKDNYRTAVGERGVRLSGGQRQRIGLARALYRRATVLVLDEATSALDSETEEAVMTAIRDLGRDLTILIVAHRLSTLDMCDRVLEVAGGAVCESSQIAVAVSK